MGLTITAVGAVARYQCRVVFLDSERWDRDLTTVATYPKRFTALLLLDAKRLATFLSNAK